MNAGPDPIAELRELARTCTACDLHELGTQTVFGEGGPGAELMLVGEQPGDREDREGRPFVGPAGQILDRGLEEAGIDRGKAYVTNAVKHFKWKPAPRGKRRIHQKPNAAEQAACRPWLEAELDAVRPRVVVCLGVTAAQALLGRGFRVGEQRGRWVEWPYEPLATATIHPSAVLRAPGDAAREAALAGFVADLRLAAEALRGS
ncbi:MAG TPA: UdgX family uracil-DNA binding protein [Acidimicrobiales bacterium]|nr:UdgX family uracil-DNA binding protein [Acidimicrobiales bacterium]